MRRTYRRSCRIIAERIKLKYPDAEPSIDELNTTGYALWMMEQLPKFTNQGKVDRWIGFVHGLIFSIGLFTISELRDLTRSDQFPNNQSSL